MPLWGCHKDDQDTLQCPSLGLTGKHWCSSPLGRCHPLAHQGTKDVAERFPTTHPLGFPAEQNPSGVGVELLSCQPEQAPPPLQPGFLQPSCLLIEMNIYARFLASGAAARVQA